jgi:hypothetical protein
VISNVAVDTPVQSLAEMPRPGPGAPWRWSIPRPAATSGSLLATVRAIACAGARPATSATTPTGVPSGEGSAAPAPGGITALHDEDVTVAVEHDPGRSNTATTTSTVVFSADTSFKVVSGRSGTATASRSSASNVGRFMAVRDTRHGNTVSASAIVIEGVPPPGTPPGGRSAPLSP